MEGSEGRRELMGRVVLLGKWKGRSLRRLMRDEGLSVLRRRGGRQRSIGPVVTLHRMGAECGQEVRHCQCRAVADSGGSLLNTEPSILVSSPHMELIRSIDKATNKVSNSPAQTHAHHQVVALRHSSTAVFASPFSTRPWVSVLMDHRRRRM